MRFLKTFILALVIMLLINNLFVVKASDIAKRLDKQFIQSKRAKIYKSVNYKSDSLSKNNFDPLNKYLATSLRFPQSAFRNHLSGYAILGIAVDSTGKVSGQKIIQSSNDVPDFGKDALATSKKFKATLKATKGQYQILILYRFRDDEYPNDKNIPYKDFAGTVVIMGFSERSVRRF